VENGYFTAQRLLYLNDTVSKLKPNLTNLISSSTDLFPLNKNLTDFQKDITNLNRKVILFSNTNNNINYLIQKICIV
jgi:hypothetical protein